MTLSDIDLSDLAAAETQRHKMLLNSAGEPGAFVLAGLSGGADSVALLHWLCGQRDALGLRLEAAHVNHGLRGEAAEADEAFCREIAAAWGVPLHVRRADVAEEARLRGIGIEEAGRDIRYAFFEQTARQIGAEKVALAHTLSDRIETFLFNFSRGTALRGLLSIPPTRALGEGTEIIRPLIACSRAQVEAYCTLHGLPYRVDATNDDENYRRNALRRNVVPPLKAAAPGLENAARRMFLSLTVDEELLAEEADKLYDTAKTGDRIWDAQILAEAHPALRGRALRRIIAQAGREPAFWQIDELSRLLPRDGAITLGGRWELRCKDGVLHLAIAEETVRKCWEQPLRLGKTVLPDGRTLQVEKFSGDFTKNLHENQKEGLANCFDYGTISGNLILGTRRPGDAMHLCNGAGTKPLKKLFQERGVSPDERWQCLVLRDDAGLVWLEGFGCAHRCRLTGETVTMMRLSIRQNNGGGDGEHDGVDHAGSFFGKGN